MTLCICGHLSGLHRHFDAGECCVVLSCSCQEYRKTALKDRPLSAGVTPEGLAEVTVAETVKAGPATEAGRLLLRLGRRNEWPSPETILAIEQQAAALERRKMVERARDRLPGYTGDLIRAILDALASEPDR